MPKKVLITGVSGLIGYHLARQCLEQHMIVRGCSRQRNSLVRELESSADFSFYPANVESKKEVNEAFPSSVDIVYHFAGQPAVWFANANPPADLSINVVGTVNILERMREVGAGKIVFPSTGDVYKDTNLANEDSPTETLNFYGLSKSTAENYIKLYNKMFSIRYSILRISLVYGPNFKRNAMFDIMKGLTDDGYIRLYTSIDSEYDFIYVDDVIEAMLQAQKESWDGKIVNISNGKGISIRNMIDIVSRLLNSEPKKVEIIENNIIRKIYSNHMAQSMGWKPRYSFEKGTSETVVWWQRI